MASIRIALLVAITAFLASPAFASGNKERHCEVKKNGKIIELSKKDAPNRKACKAKGGKWVKNHDHDHGDGDGHHEHEEN